MTILEEFKNCLPQTVETFLNKWQVPQGYKAAKLADKFVLTPKSVFVLPSCKKSDESIENTAGLKSSSFTQGKKGVQENVSEFDQKLACFYCKSRCRVMWNA